MSNPPSAARLLAKGRPAESFAVGQVFVHHWGRTVEAADSTLFTSLTLCYNPVYLNREYAVAAGHPDLVINPYLVFCLVFGLSVEDLSESRQGGGAFLGVEDLRFLAPVHPGDTLYAQSRVTAVRRSQSRPGQVIVTWATEGRNQDGVPVVAFRRTNLRRSEAADE